MEKIVIDANVLFSLLKPASGASYVFSLARAKFLSPDFAISELYVHKDAWLEKSGLSEHEFEMRCDEVKGKIRLFPLSAYSDLLKTSRDSLTDPDDAPYVALARSLNASIWSNDTHLKVQSLARVFSTTELIGKMLKGEF